MAEILRRKQQVIVVDLESVYGTDVTPTGASAVLAHDMTVNLLENNADQLDDINGRFGAQGSISTSQWASSSFGVRFAGSGAAVTPPAWGTLMQLCGMAQTIGASSVTYSPVSETFKSGSMYYRLKKLQQKLLGTRGKFVLNLDKGAIPGIKYDLMSLYSAPTVQAQDLASIDTSAYKNPLAVKSDTCAVTLFGGAVSMSKLSIDPGIMLKRLDDIDADEVAIEDRKGSISMAFRTTEQELVDYITRANTNAKGALNYVLGTVAGSTLTVAVPQVQVSKAAIEWDGEFAYCRVEADIVPTAANTDLTIVQS